MPFGSAPIPGRIACNNAWRRDWYAPRLQVTCQRLKFWALPGPVTVADSLQVSDAGVRQRNSSTFNALPIQTSNLLIGRRCLSPFTCTSAPEITPGVPRWRRSCPQESVLPFCIDVLLIQAFSLHSVWLRTRAAKSRPLIFEYRFKREPIYFLRWRLPGGNNKSGPESPLKFDATF